jgi:hypothetical protein
MKINSAREGGFGGRIGIQCSLEHHPGADVVPAHNTEGPTHGNNEVLLGSAEHMPGSTARRTRIPA